MSGKIVTASEVWEQFESENRRIVDNLPKPQESFDELAKRTGLDKIQDDNPELD